MKQNNLPLHFIEKINKMLSQNDFNACIEAFKVKKRKPAFRINFLKANENDVLIDLEENALKHKKIAFLKWGFILENWDEKSLQKTKSYKNWWIYLQNISSQIPVSFFSDWEKLDILDACASPWWKTSQLSQDFPTSNITALDLTQVRIDKLVYNINHLWCKNVDIIKKNIVDYSASTDKKFDRILLDVPCSWEGRFNENREKSFAHYSQSFVRKVYKKQLEIAKSAIPLLKEDWELIYSTCSMSFEENEWIVHAILSNFKELEIEEIFLNTENQRPALKSFDKKIFNKNTVKALRFLPNETFQWFFVAKFKKKTI